MQWILLLGIATGLRTLTPIAVFCWFAYLQRTPVHGWAFWSANIVSAIVFTVMAAGEYVGDTLPQTPNRTSAFPATARALFGGLVGALAVNTITEPAAGGAILGALGAIAGTWGGFRVRARCTKFCGRDLPVAVIESAIAMALAVWAMHHIQLDVRKNAIWWHVRLAAARS